MSAPCMQPSLVLAFTAVAVVGNCMKPPAERTPAPTASTSAPMATEPVHLFTQQSSGYRAAAELAIRDGAAWTAAWRTLHDGDPADAAPSVDFGRDMVVLVSVGQLSTGGSSVHVDSVVAGGGGAVVRYTVTQPGAGCMTTQALSAPVDVVRVPTVAGAVRFQRQTVREDC